MIKILIGGSPCTYWSVAQKKGREVEAEGLGWELFRNYLIAKEKFKPDFFLYENNKSAAQPIKDQISHELGVDLMHINSALVSAQNRQRFYAFNWNVDQPADRGIMLKDILETTTSEKGYELRAPAVGVGCRNRREDDGKLYRRFETSGIPKANALTTVQTDSMVAEPIRIGTIGEAQGAAWRGRDNGSAYEVRTDGKANALTASGHQSRLVVTNQNGEDLPVYEVVNGEIEIKGKKYPIKLPDGYYVIRKFTPTECERLQTLPDGYTSAVSATQRYRGLGNGWTAEVIIHILTGALKDVPRDEEIVVLSMYDGIGTGRYCLDKMGFTNVTYYAYEIDKPAMTVALSNYPDIIQLGDAFDLRRDDWALGKRFEHTTEQKAETPENPDQTTDLSDAPEEIKEQIIENDRALKEKDDTALALLPDGFDVVDQLSELLAERKKLHIIDEENLRYNCDIIALEYAIGTLRR
ncbi:DNA cytosine methyltransferase [Butyricicoccus pullicaecorum]|uniref:DNA (cytosine-5-)-methyltransferase n=1 Tax=Butyricicoccus pullicaecorum 1.2 TaxID=1203606 RepID=R8VX88_9FIRM|nr:DNA cytosine methyltransferase [Butyricicoccus pullicaecorum]EOQ37183.1 hypothetical protein HMPREF1526_01874 [Butyricicoccus pullicaecorum 1.2]SKA58523.1 Site-specific DNA-cytosine methylase [Butyricicoccus pullicaecorum DSM 23266]